MKHAVIITAYKNFWNLYMLVKILSNDFYCYIHIDKKSNISYEQIGTLLEFPNTSVIKKYKINWGSYNHLLCIIDMLKKSVLNKDVDYFHIISGEDFITKSPEKVYQYINSNYGCNYMTLTRVENNEVFDSNLVERYKYYYFLNIINLKSRFGRLINSILIKIQKIIGINRIRSNKYLSNIYKGMVYVTISKSAVKYILDYINTEPKFLKTLKKCYIPEEFFFQTILMNSQFKKTIINNNLRYIEWITRYNSYPAILDETCYDNIVDSGCLFARKFGKDISNKLLDNLILHINKSEF